MVARSVASGAPGPVSAHVLRRRDHRGSTNLDVRLASPGWRRDVFVKRLKPHAFDRYRNAVASGEVHGLTLVSNPDRRLAEEAVALRAIENMVRRSGRNEWFAVEVDDALSDHEVLVLGRVSRPTLAELMAVGDRSDTAMLAARALGVWVRAFHSSDPLDHAIPHLDGRESVMVLADRMIAAIGKAVPTGWHGQLTEAMLSLPADLPVGPSHGVLRASNVFVDEEGGVAVFDTSADALSPAHADLARLVVDLELDAAEPMWSRAIRRSWAVDLAKAALDGYGPTAPPEGERRIFEVLVLLDRWASITRRGSASIMPIQLAKRVRRDLVVRRIRGMILERLVVER